MRIRVTWRDMVSGVDESRVIDVGEFEEWWEGEGLKARAVRVRKVEEGEAA